MKKRKISFQKIFNLVSFVFILTCCIFYGSRFIKLYLENQEKVVIETNTLGKELKVNNQDKLKNINNTLYFNGNVETNYVTYSGILWRVIKIEENNVITLVSNNSLTSLAFGENTEYTNSYVNTWLNRSDKNNSGILEKNLNSMITYLKNADLCADKIDNVNDYSCENINNDYFITTLSIEDYINTGADNGFINTKESFYLSNQASDNNVWYINSDGKINKTGGTDIMGVKPVIKLKENLELISGTGSKDDPYVIEKVLGLFGSYVKLGEDIWRVIDVKDNNLKLVYNDYLHDGSDIISYKYSNYSSYHDDSKYNTLAYYLKNTFLNKLSYKDIIIETDYANGYYGKENNFDYSETLNTTIKTKVALVSIGDIILNHDLHNYFTLTSSSTKKNFVYTIQNDSIPYSKIISSTAHVVPVITINKDALEGTGSKNDPLRLVTNNE